MILEKNSVIFLKKSRENIWIVRKKLLPLQ